MFAIWELWKRWKPDQYGIHMLDDLIEEIVEADNRDSIFSEYLRFWKLTKEHIILPLQIRSLEDLNNRFEWYYDMKALFFDLEIEFVDTFLRDKVHRKQRFAELISLYEDLLQILPDSDLSTIQQMRCSLAQAYYYSGDTAYGEQLFQQLIHDYPYWAGGYGGWGDMYAESLFLPEIYNEEKAMEIYQVGLHQCEEKDELEERVKDMAVD
jgi:hypothetical protein